MVGTFSVRMNVRMHLNLLHLNVPRPMPHLPTLETSARITGILRSPSTTMRELHSNFVAHEITLVILRHTGLSSLPTVKFL
jgi:hypothetical protein